MRRNDECWIFPTFLYNTWRCFFEIQRTNDIPTSNTLTWHVYFGDRHPPQQWHSSACSKLLTLQLSLKVFSSLAPWLPKSSIERLDDYCTVPDSYAFRD